MKPEYMMLLHDIVNLKPSDENAKNSIQERLDFYKQQKDFRARQLRNAIFIGCIIGVVLSALIAWVF